MRYILLVCSLCVLTSTYGVLVEAQPSEDILNVGHIHYRNCSVPPICECLFEKSILTANCGSKNISPGNIPKFYDQVSIIILNGNKIKELPENNHFGSKLLYLYLRDNGMSKIHRDAFQNLTNLILLDLSDNQLTSESDILQQGVFRDLEKLQTLFLGENSVTNQSPVDYPDKAISDLVSLKSLFIDGQTNKSFGYGFSRLTQLEELHFSGVPKICKIYTLNVETFQYLVHLKVINATLCLVINVERNTFSSLRNLTHLILSRNIYLGFKDLRNISYDLQFTSIKILELEKLYDVFGLGTMICLEDAMFLSNTSLETLKIDSNRLELMEIGILTLLPKTLRNVTMTDNKLTYSPYVWELPNLKGLKKFNGSHQFTAHPLFTNDNVDNYDTRSCKTKTTNWSPLASNQSLSIYTRSNVNALPFPLPPHVEIVDFSSSSLNLNHLGPMKFQNTSLKQLRVANNIVEKLIGPLIGLNELELLDISNIFCTEVSDIFFDTFSNLLTLYMQQNYVGFSLRLDENGNIFKSLTKLRALDISENKIDILPVIVFRGLINLEWINLRNNSLTGCNFSLSHMKKLEYMDLSFNQITDLSKPMMTYLDTRADGGIHVNALGNTFICNCDTLTFLEWFRKKQSIFISSENYFCIHNGHLENMTNIDLSKMRKTCTSYIGLIIGTIVCILLVNCVIIAGLIYRFRWKLRYLYYMAKNRYMGYTPVSNEANDDYMYDAFVAYSDSQRKFVTNDMLEKLEKDYDLSLCIHHRDFLPGNEIGANITDAIHKSRWTVAIVSRDFLKSYWCMFELNMARMESIYSRDGRNTLFLVLYENDIPEHLPLEFYDLINSQSYIEYPGDPQGNVVFWDKVRERLTRL